MEAIRTVRNLGAAVFLSVCAAQPSLAASLPQAFGQAERLGAGFQKSHADNQLLLELYRTLWRLEEERGNLLVELSASTRAVSQSCAVLRGLGPEVGAYLRDKKRNPADMTDDQIVQVIMVWTRDDGIFFKDGAALPNERNILTKTIYAQALRDRIAVADKRIAEVRQAIDRHAVPGG